MAAQPYTSCYKAGVSRNIHTVVHAVPSGAGFQAALCGARPFAHPGWVTADGEQVTCLDCDVRLPSPTEKASAPAQAEPPHPAETVCAARSKPALPSLDRLDTAIAAVLGRDAVRALHEGFAGRVRMHELACLKAFANGLETDDAVVLRVMFNQLHHRGAYPSPTWGPTG